MEILIPLLGLVYVVCVCVCCGWVGKKKCARKNEWGNGVGMGGAKVY